VIRSNGAFAAQTKKERIAMGRGALRDINEKFAEAVRHHAHGRLPEAETICRHLLRAAPRFTEAMVLLAVTLCLEDRHDKRLQAIALLRRALELAPRDVQALEILGDALTAEGDQEGAIEVYRRAIAIDPSRASLHSKLGTGLSAYGRYDDAIASYRQALAHNPDAVQTYINLGIALTDANRREEAIDAYRQAVARRPDDVETHFRIGVLCKENGSTGPAIEAFRTAVLIDQHHVEARLELAACLHNAIENDEAHDIICDVIARSPHLPDAHLLRGNILLALHRYAHARDAFKAELLHNPGCVQAHNNLGVALSEMGEFAAAAAQHKQALALDPTHVMARINLGVAQQWLGDLSGAQAIFEEVIATPAVNNGSLAKAMANLGLVLEQQGEYAASIDLFRRGIALAPEQGKIHFNLAINLLRTGDLPGGWDEYEWRWRGGVPTLKMPKFPKPLWDGSDLDGRTLLVHVEQGFGDTLQFCRYLESLARAQGRIVLVAPAPLKRLLQGLEGVTMASADALPPFDVHVPLMSLARIMGTRLETIPAAVPYLAVEPADVAAWRRRLGSDRDLKVGIVWSGNPKHKYDNHRSLTAAQLLPRLVTPGVKLFSLQKDVRGADSDAVAGMSEAITDLTPELNDFYDTGAALSALDLVISVDTSVAHLAGALARPVWTLLPFTPDWRWLLEREDSVWYPSMQLFRQGKRGDWDEVVSRVRAELGLQALRHAVALPATAHLAIHRDNRAAIDIVEATRAGRGRA
jgi:tetratricopeptide (TPR) repeat protein